MLHLPSLALVSLSWLGASAVDLTKDPELVGNLATAATQLDRLAYLSKDSDWTFDFTAQKYYSWSPGGVINMNVATFPAVEGNHLTMAMINLGPCGMLPPHFHPRAANWVVAIEGRIDTFMQEENGAHTIQTQLTPGQATIFPAGSMHMMYNNECSRAQLVAALSSTDAGTLNVGQIFVNGFPPDWVNAAFGSALVNNDSSARMHAPGTGANWGSAECLARCKISPANGTGA